MIIGIVGRGGTGKTTLAKDIIRNHKNFVHLEVDTIIEEELSKSKNLLERIKKEIGKSYTFDEIRETFFSNDEEAKKIKKIFFEELNEIILEKTKNKSKDYVIEHFLLDDYDTINYCDYKIKLVADEEERIERIKKRGNMPIELYKEVDKMFTDKDNSNYDLIFNIKDYKSELISIIIPVYNAEKYIRETLDAVTNQTYKNLEIVIVNDGSTDNTLEILNEYAKNDNRIKIITTPNLNVSHARNVGLKKATGKYVAFMDSDDLINKEYISCLYDAINISKADLAHAAIYINREGSTTGYISTKSRDLIYVNDPKKGYLTMDVKFAVWGKLFKKELLENIEFELIPCFEDFKYMWEVAKKAKSAVVTADATYSYIQRTKDSLTQKCYSDVNKELINHAKKILVEGYYTDEAKKFFYGCLLFNLVLYISSYNNPNFKDKYKEEIFECIRLLEEYKDYKFCILEFQNIDIDEIINHAKELVGLNTIGVFWNSMDNNIEDAKTMLKKKQLLQIQYN